MGSRRSSDDLWFSELTPVRAFRSVFLLCILATFSNGMQGASVANSFGIRPEIEAAIRERDTLCVYCSREMRIYVGVRGTRSDMATIEHLNHRPPFHWKDGLEADGIVICCGSCNASRGAKTHVEWFRSRYCLERAINSDTVAEPVRAYLSRVI